MKIERTKNAIQNVKWGVIQRIIRIGMPFLVRTVLIYTLSAEYAGLNSLFSSILQILSLTELGFSNAIVFSMYRPIAEDNKEKICALLNVYKKTYRIIGIIILGIGIIIIPFLPYMIKDTVPADINLYTLYLVYLSNTVISYFLFAYKTSLLTAHQREDLISKNTLLFNIICYGLQCVVLLICKNYYVYAIVLPLSTVILNLLNNYTARKYFSEYRPYGTIENEEKKELKKNVVGLMIWKVGGVTRNTFDSIVISSFIGLTAVAIYNNYFFILNGVSTVLGVICTSITAGIGNKITVESPEKNYSDFKRFHFYYMWIAGWCTVCLMCLYQPFMRIWMGEELMLPNGVMLLFCYYFIMLKQGDINSVYYQAAGLWWHGKMRSIIEAALNLILNLVLGKLFGITGILLATIISFTCIYFYGSKFVFTECFKNKKTISFYIENIMLILIIFGVGFLTFFLCDLLFSTNNSITGIVLRLLLCAIAPNIVFIVIFSQSSRYRGYIIRVNEKCIAILKKKS